MKRRQNYINTGLQKSLLQFFVYLKRRRSIKNTSRLTSRITTLFKVFNEYCLSYLKNMINFYLNYLIKINYSNFTGLFRQSNLKFKYSIITDNLVLNYSESAVSYNFLNYGFLPFVYYKSLLDLYRLFIILNYK